MNKEKTFKEKAVGFYNDHKAVIITSVVTALVGVALYNKFGGSAPETSKKSGKYPWVPTEIPEETLYNPVKSTAELIVSTASMLDVAEYSSNNIKHVDCIVNDLELSNAGKFGQELMEAFKLKDNATISAAVYMKDNDNTDIQ